MELENKKYQLADKLDLYRKGQITNWHLQDQLTECVGLVPDSILEELDLLIDDFPECKLTMVSRDVEFEDLISRISLFLKSGLPYQRSQVDSDGVWPFTLDQYRELGE